jgi:signal transduction histidine kinase
MLTAAVSGRRGDRTRCLDRIHAALRVTAGRDGAAALAKMLRGVANAIGATNLRVELTPDGRRLPRRPSTRVLARDAGAAECSRPLAVGGRRLGVLYARYSRGCPTRDDQSRLALAAQELAVTVDRVAAQALDHIDRHRMDEVIGMLAHELRTPLAAIGSAMAGDAAVIRVKDAGAGIPPTMLQRVFEPFVQATRRTRGGEPGGHGVGLALVIAGRFNREPANVLPRKRGTAERSACWWPWPCKPDRSLDTRTP